MQLVKIVGQTVATHTLSRALQTDRIAHAYLFSGEAGIGKETTARSFINHLLCENKTACGSCPSCQKLKHGNHPGFRLIESTTSIKIEQIREIKDNVQLSNDDYVIWLIKNADKMTLQAANSFLKVLEEPPKFNIFILLTNNIGQVLPTIRSRCQTITFTRLTDSEVAQLLTEKLSLDKVEHEQRAKISVISKMARGSIGKAIELWNGSALERRNWVISQLVQIPQLSIPQVLGLSWTWSEERDQVIGDLELMLQWYRDLWCVKSGCADNIYNVDYLNHLTKISQKYSQNTLEQITCLIPEMVVQIQRNVRIRFILGHLLLQMKKGALA